ncbi:MAG: branched-chain amino acid ABC transporter permease [Spirochaetes bacterium]|nr:MAG: branched-chain amino acid ABC transporter permease [Spirochaetota bacterium]
MKPRGYIPVAVLAAVLAAFQLLVSFTGQEFFLTQLTMSAYYVLAVMGLCLLMGYAGQISLGHAAFFAIGGYTAAVLGTFNAAPYQDGAVVRLLLKTGLASASDAATVHVSPWAALGLAVLLALAVSVVIGVPILRLRGHYLAMATLGFGLIVHRIVLGTHIFGEADGISDLPAFPLFAGLSVSGRPELRVSNYYIAWTIVVLGMALLLNLVNSRPGRALRAIHDNEEAARAMGVDTARYKLNVFVLSAVFTAVAGVFLTHFNAGIGPAEADVMKSVRYVAIVAVGGMANLWGALAMGLSLNYISLRGYLGSYDDAFFGAVLILIMIFAPEGLLNAERPRAILGQVKALAARMRKKGGEGGAP